MFAQENKQRNKKTDKHANRQMDNVPMYTCYKWTKTKKESLA